MLYFQHLRSNSNRARRHFLVVVALMSSSTASSSYPRIEFSRSTQQMTIYPHNDRALHTHTLILLHGLGDTARGWQSVGVDLATQFKTLKVILPTAPSQPVTLNGGMLMPSWYDIKASGVSRSLLC
jgi:hypothetical protein